MTHPCELLTSATLSELRNADLDVSVENNAHLTPDIYFNWDDEEGAVEMSATSQPGALLNVSAQVDTAPRWFSVNVGLGTGAFAAGDVVGLIIEASTENAFATEMFVRSAVSWDEGYVDTNLQDALNLPGGRQVVTLLHTVEAEDGLSYADGYHTLVVRLPAQDFDLNLHDVRFFVLGADRGVRSTPVQLSSFG